MRSQPNLKSKLVITIPLGARLDIPDLGAEEIEINGIKGKWLKADYEKYSGWVFSGYLEKDYVPNLRDHLAAQRKKYCKLGDDIVRCLKKVEKGTLTDETASHLTRLGKNLKITLQNGQEKILIDQPDAEKGNVIIYTFLGFFEPIILIQKQFYEGDDFMGVDIRTGQQIKLYREPIFSPDRKRFFSFSSCNEPGYCFPGFRVDRIEEEKIASEFVMENELVIRAVWKSDSEIELLMPPEKKSNRPRVVKKKLNGFKWQ
jgi:hypothetical protein